jgi:hypothetical protein
MCTAGVIDSGSCHSCHHGALVLLHQLNMVALGRLQLTDVQPSICT